MHLFTEVFGIPVEIEYTHAKSRVYFFPSLYDLSRQTFCKKELKQTLFPILKYTYQQYYSAIDNECYLLKHKSKVKKGTE